MYDAEFVVSPVEGGWMVESSTGLAPLMFYSGARAEAKAEAIARAITASGLDARVVVLDRTGRLAGTKRFWAQEPASKAAAQWGALAPAH
jgi:hypothetical protein